MLHRQRELGGVPKIVVTNTAAEYWRGDGSLIHTDPSGQSDLPVPDGERIYFLAGAQHSPGELPLAPASAAEGSGIANPLNALDYTPLLRAALINLDRWVTTGAEPPPSVFPRLSDGTAIPPAATLATFQSIPGLAVPSPEGLRCVRRFDLGPDADRGIGHFPPAIGEPYPAYVSAVDADGNEVGGIRLPDIAVPVATYTGWNPRHLETGGRGQIVDMLGSTCPFAATVADRLDRNDPRSAIAERYKDRDDYRVRAHTVAVLLARDRYLLEEDVDLTADLALARYDAFARPIRP